MFIANDLLPIPEQRRTHPCKPQGRRPTVAQPPSPPPLPRRRQNPVATPPGSTWAMSQVGGSLLVITPLRHQQRTPRSPRVEPGQ